MYTVEIQEGEKRNEFEDRQQAVKVAKNLSENTHQTVKVLNDGRYERLMFRRGELQEGIYVTPDRRRRMGPLH